MVVLPTGHPKEWFLDDYVDQVGHIEQHDQDELNNRVPECHNQEDNSSQFMQITQHRER